MMLYLRCASVSNNLRQDNPGNRFDINLHAARPAPMIMSLSTENLHHRMSNTVRKNNIIECHKYTHDH